jgi:hypothetical protein
LVEIRPILATASAVWHEPTLYKAARPGSDANAKSKAEFRLIVISINWRLIVEAPPTSALAFAGVNASLLRPQALKPVNA